MSDHSNDITLHGYSAFAQCTGSATSERQNLPLDRYGGVDWRAMDAIKLRSYSTADLKAELERRGQ